MLHKNPPGPRNINASFGLTWRHLLNLWWDPIRFVTKLGHTYGDLSFFRAFNQRVYLVNAPSLIRDVLVVNQKSYRKMDRPRKVLASGFGNGLILSEGPGWLQQRRALQPVFQTQRMNRYAAVTVAHTQRLLASWRGKPRVNLGVEMTHLAMTIIGDAMFHADLTDRAPHFSRMAFEATDIFASEEYKAFLLPDWLPLRSKRRKVAITRQFRELMKQLFVERRAASKPEVDLLTVLLAAIDKPASEGGMTEAQALDEAMTLFNGGYHSSSMALTWLLYTLTQHPEVYARVCAEVDEVLRGREATFDDLSSLRYTNMVVKESLRLHPAAWELFARENIEDVELGGYHIPRGGIFLIYPIVTQRDPRFFADPLRFDPERFSPEREKEIPNCAYLPFGAGPHVCIGQAFATMEIALVLATMAQQINVELAPGQTTDVKPIPRIAIRPDRDIFVTPVVRSAAAEGDFFPERKYPAVHFSDQGY